MTSCFLLTGQRSGQAAEGRRLAILVREQREHHRPAQHARGVPGDRWGKVDGDEVDPREAVSVDRAGAAQGSAWVR